MLFCKTRLSFIRRLVDKINELGHEGIEIVALPVGFDGVIDSSKVEQHHIEGHITVNGHEIPSKFQVHSIVGIPSQDEEYDFVIFPTLNPKIMMQEYAKDYSDIINFLSQEKVVFGYKLSTISEKENVNGTDESAGTDSAFLQDNSNQDDTLGEFEDGDKQASDGEEEE